MHTKWPARANPRSEDFALPATTAVLLGDDGVRRPPLDLEWAHMSAARLQQLRAEMRSAWIGLDDQIDWLLATIIARENALLVGPPGVAKTELATRLFKLLGLDRSAGLAQVLHHPHLFDADSGQVASVAQQWLARESHERSNQKYFHYLLSRFTQPEELFGPVEIGLLRQGLLVRVNHGLLTGAGVRAVFLDEVFKASPAILNTLLPLMAEREFFNWGGMERADLHVLIGASNEMPGGFGTGSQGSATDDFATLHAFLDRFAVRLHIPAPSTGDPGADPTETPLARATSKAVDREQHLFCHGRPFATRPIGMPSINDVLLLGRWLLEGDAFNEEPLTKFRACFFDIGRDLHDSGTSSAEATVTWSISPRKLKALWKIAQAHALVVDDRFHQASTKVAGPDCDQAPAFAHIWDAEAARAELRERVDSTITLHFPHYCATR